MLVASISDSGTASWPSTRSGPSNGPPLRPHAAEDTERRGERRYRIMNKDNTSVRPYLAVDPGRSSSWSRRCSRYTRDAHAHAGFVSWRTRHCIFD